MSRFKRTEIIRFPSASATDEAKAYWDRLTDPVTVQEYGAINSLHICPTNQLLVAATAYSKVQVYNTESRDLHKSLTKFQDTAFGGRWRKDGGLLVAGTGEGQVKVFDVATKTMLRVLKGHTAAVRRCDFTEDISGTGKGVVSWSDDKTVVAWDLPTETATATFSAHTDYVRAGALLPNSPDLVVSASYDHTAMLWDRRLDCSAGASLEVKHGAPVEACLVTSSGGLLVTAGGTMVKIWDLVAGGRLLSSLSPHHKTVTSLCMSGTGKYLVTGSLDRQAHLIDLASFRSSYTLQYPASVMAVAVSKDDSLVVAGMLDGLVQWQTLKEDEVKDGMRTDTRRYKKMTSHRYLQHTAFTPSPGDEVVKAEKRDIELRHDTLLRKFEYNKALDQVLRPYVMRKKPEYTYSLLMELSRREGLRRALAACDERSLCNMLQFINRNISDSRFTLLLVHVADLLMDIFLPQHGFGGQVDILFKQLRSRLDKEVNYCEELMQLQGAVDLVLSAANNSREVEEVKHVVVDKSKLPTVAS